MNPRRHLVIIKGLDRTEEVREVVHDSASSVVTFANGSAYRYHSNNVALYSNPEVLAISGSRLSIGGSLLSDVQEALRFGNWVKVFHGTGSSRLCPSASIAIQGMTLPDGRSKDVLAYFRELSDGSALRTDDDNSLLAEKFRHLDCVSPGSILSGFLQCRPPLPEPVSPIAELHLIFPFGCNMSQKAAVLAPAAFDHRER